MGWLALTHSKMSLFSPCLTLVEPCAFFYWRLMQCGMERCMSWGRNAHKFFAHAVSAAAVDASTTSNTCGWFSANVFYVVTICFSPLPRTAWIYFAVRAVQQWPIAVAVSLSLSIGVRSPSISCFCYFFYFFDCCRCYYTCSGWGNGTVEFCSHQMHRVRRFHWGWHPRQHHCHSSSCPPIKPANQVRNQIRILAVCSFSLSATSSTSLSYKDSDNAHSHYSEWCDEWLVPMRTQRVQCPKNQKIKHDKISHPRVNPKRLHDLPKHSHNVQTSVLPGAEIQNKAKSYTL